MEILALRPAGVEPTTFGFGGRHSIQLSYGRESTPSVIPLRPGVKLRPTGNRRGELKTSSPFACESDQLGIWKEANPIVSKVIFHAKASAPNSFFRYLRDGDGRRGGCFARNRTIRHRF